MSMKSAILEAFEETLRGQQRELTDTTIDRYLWELPKWAEWLEAERDKDLLEATTADLRVHFRQMTTAGYANTSINCRRSAISRFYDKLPVIAEDYPHLVDFTVEDVPENPSTGLDRVWSAGETKTSAGLRGEGADEGIHYLEPPELVRLIENAPAPTLRNELILRLLYDTGCRRSELVRIQLDDIDRDDDKIWIEAHKSPKGRWVTYTPEYVGWHLNQWLNNGYRDATYFAREHDSEYLFPTTTSKHISGYQVNSIVGGAAERADLQATIGEYAGETNRKVRRITAHTLRHSHAVQAVRSGIDIRRLAESLGHISENGNVNIDTTMSYLRLAEKEYVDESRKFNPGTVGKKEPMVQE